MSAKDASAAGRCPACGKPAEPRCRPFCSRRCADLDLWRWLGGTYKIPTGERPASSAEGLEEEDG